MTESINNYSYRTWENVSVASKSLNEVSDNASVAQTSENSGWWGKTFAKAKESVKNMIGEGKAFAEKHPNLVKLGKTAGRILKTANPISIVLNLVSGYDKGEEVAAEHANGNAEHDAKIYDGATTGGAFGAIAGGVVGATAGAAAGSVVPIIGTGIGAAVGFVTGCIGGAIGSYLGGTAGANIGANAAENQYNNEQYDKINSYRPPNASVENFFSW